MGDAFRIDESSDLGARAAGKLRDAPVVWLTTVTASGAPSPNPVWFLWDGAGDVLTYALPSAARVTHLQANPHVTLSFDGNGHGGDIVVLNGTAGIALEAARADAVPDYLAKYGAQLPNLNLTPAGFAETYNVPIRIRLTKLRGHA